MHMHFQPRSRRSVELAIEFLPLLTRRTRHDRSLVVETASPPVALDVGNFLPGHEVGITYPVGSTPSESPPKGPSPAGNNNRNVSSANGKSPSGVHGPLAAVVPPQASGEEHREEEQSGQLGAVERLAQTQPVDR